MPTPPPPDELLAELLAAYELAPPVTWVPLSAGAHDLYRVETGERPFVLKLYRAGWRSRKEVQVEVAALHHLARRGISVALPQPDREGNLVRSAAAPDGERPAVLFEFAPGEPPAAVDARLCRQLGRTLAQIHQASDDFKDPPVRFDLDHLWHRPLRALLPLLDDRPTDCDFLEMLSDRLVARLDALPPEARDWGFCHGDFRPANIHRDEEGRLAILDFEACGTGFRAYDLATLRFFLAGKSPAYGDSEPLWEAFVEGYAEVRPLSSDQRDALPLFIPLRPLRILGNVLQTVQKNWKLEPLPPSQAGPLPNPAFFEGVLDFLRAWAVRHL